MFKEYYRDIGISSVTQKRGMDNTFKKESDNTWSRKSMEPLFKAYEFLDKFKPEFNNKNFVITNKIANSEVFDAVIDSNSGSLSKVTWSDIQELLSI